MMGMQARVPEARAMNETSQPTASPLWRWARIAGLSLAMIFLLGVAAGAVAAHLDDGGGFSLRVTGLIAAVLLLIAGCAWLLRRDIRGALPADPLTPKERLNRNILVACGLLGGVIGVALAVASPDIAEHGVFSNAPLPVGLAIVLVIALGLLVPAISYYWHRHAVDEQEADAYRSGALAAMYVYMVVTPVWWFAWRGGFAPAPDGIVIYMATVAVLGVVWIWKKYG